VEGYSKFGSYTGNGSTDGPFIALSFRPAFLLVKRTTGTTGNWVMFDTARSPNNPVNEYLTANDAQAEFGASNAFDIVSNGFKLRGDWGSANTSSAPYVYMAFAENPFGGENAPPATAR
jgi:hypothetical protein